MEKYCPKCFQTYGADASTCPADGATLVGQEERSLIGEVLDNRYRIHALVGQGGMGVVYRAEQEIIGRVVALKVLRRDIVRDANLVKRFLTEAKAIASLTSRNTVTLYDFGVTSEGLLYYTMELLEGASLSELIETHGTIPVDRAVDIVLQACNSLAEANDHGILHRDIKPENIFVATERDGTDLVKVLDFGIAKLMGDQSMGTLTQTGMICGTPAYLAPEQALGNPAGESADLYSLAITFYEALAGKPPFVADTAMKLLLKHINEEPPALLKTNPEIVVPSTLDVFLRTALAKEPHERFTTVDAFREGLEEALRRHDQSPEISHIPRLETTSIGTRIIAGTDRAAEFGTAETLIHPTPILGTEAAPEVEPAPPRSRLPLFLGIGAAALLAIALLLWQPWKAATPGTEAPETGIAEAPIEAPAAPAIDPAAEKARIDAEIERRIRAAEDEARHRVEA